MTDYNLSDTEELIRDLIVKNKELKAEIGRMNSLINITNNLLKQASGADYQRGYEEGFAEGRKRTELSELQDDEIRVGDEVFYEDPVKSKFVVLRLEEEGECTYAGGYSLDPDSNAIDGWNYCDVRMLKKTGRHFDSITKLYEEVSNEH